MFFNNTLLYLIVGSRIIKYISCFYENICQFDDKETLVPNIWLDKATNILYFEKFWPLCCTISCTENAKLKKKEKY